MNELRIILIEPLYSGNIGSAARVIKNFGFSSLYLVNPRCPIDDYARQMASSAQDILADAKICRSIEEAVGDANLVCAATSINRLRHPINPIHIIVPQIMNQNKIAVLFGREEKGLKNSELAKASMLINIPSSTAYPSFNLAVSVGLVCYEFFKNSNLSINHEIEIADRYSYEAMYNTLEKLLLENDYCNENELTKKMIRVRRIFDRTQLDTREIKILIGLFKTLGE